MVGSVEQEREEEDEASIPEAKKNPTKCVLNEKCVKENTLYYFYKGQSELFRCNYKVREKEVSNCS